MDCLSKSSFVAAAHQRLDVAKGALKELSLDAVSSSFDIYDWAGEVCDASAEVALAEKRFADVQKRTNRIAGAWLEEESKSLVARPAWVMPIVIAPTRVSRGSALTTPKATGASIFGKIL